MIGFSKIVVGISKHATLYNKLMSGTPYKPRALVFLFCLQGVEMLRTRITRYEIALQRYKYVLVSTVVCFLKTEKERKNVCNESAAFAQRCCPRLARMDYIKERGLKWSLRVFSCSARLNHGPSTTRLIRRRVRSCRMDRG